MLVYISVSSFRVNRLQWLAITRMMKATPAKLIRTASMRVKIKKVCTVTRLQDGWSRGQFLAGGKGFFSSSEHSELYSGPLSLQFNDYWNILIIKPTRWNILMPLASSQHNLYDIYLLLCVQCYTPDDGQRTCPNTKSFIPKINLRISASHWFHYKNISWRMVLWMSKVKDYWKFFLWRPSNSGMKLATHLRLEPRLRKSGDRVLTLIHVQGKHSDNCMVTFTFNIQ